jgi:hypothetical protein
MVLGLLSNATKGINGLDYLTMHTQPYFSVPAKKPGDTVE